MNYGTEYMVLFIFIYIIFYVAFSALCAVILWGCARGIGKVENATYLNSWGLFWILTVLQILIGILQWFFTYLIIGYSYNPYAYGMYNSGSVIFLWIIFYIVSVLVALSISKTFWKCTFKQSFMAHLVPMIIYFSLMFIGILFWVTVAGDMY